VLKNITETQWVAFVIGAASFIGGATAQLTVLFGTLGASITASACALISGVAGVFLMATTGQGATMQQVARMPGIQKVLVNEDANATQATLAVDPAEQKIGPTPEAKAAVTATASAAS
jgi:hypothetical protein